MRRRPPPGRSGEGAVAYFPWVFKPRDRRVFTELRGKWMKVIGPISTVVDWLVDKGVCAGGGGVCVTDRRVKSAINRSPGVWKTAGVFAIEGGLG